MKARRILFLGLGIGILAVLIGYPWKRVVVVPAIRVRILDEVGNPAPGAIVQEKWEYRTIGSIGHREVSRADENGYAAFPERSERISLLRLVPSYAREIIYLPHGYGYGSKVTVWAYGDDPHVWYYVPFSWRETFPLEIRLKRGYEIRTPDDNKWP
jgi:hypothetical protein